MQPPSLPEPSTEQRPETKLEQAGRDYPIPGKFYTIHAGDSLTTIAQAATAFGQIITVGEILEANPGLDASRLLIGQKIMIPGDKANGSTMPAPEGSTSLPANESLPAR